MKRHWLKIVLAIPTLAVAVYLYDRGWGAHEDIVQKVFGSQQLFDSFVGAQQVTAQRLHWRVEDKVSPNELSNYRRGQSIPVSASEAEKLKRLLQRSSSYYQGSAVKACVPDYGVLFIFRSGERTVQVALCFNCNMLRIFDGADDKARGVNTLMDFDPMRSELVAVVKKVFPDDAEIQNLEGRR
jgi:hypothetical protein